MSVLHVTVISALRRPNQPLREINNSLCKKQLRSSALKSTKKADGLWCPFPIQHHLSALYVRHTPLTTSLDSLHWNWWQMMKGNHSAALQMNLQRLSYPVMKSRRDSHTHTGTHRISSVFVCHTRRVFVKAGWLYMHNSCRIITSTWTPTMVIFIHRFTHYGLIRGSVRGRDVIIQFSQGHLNILLKFRV